MKKTRTFFKLQLVALSIFAFTACDNSSKNLIREREMADILTDIYSLEGYYAVERGTDSLITDSVIVATYDSIFASHSVTPQQFDESLRYYMRHADRFSTIHKRVNETLNRETGQ